MTQTEFIQMAQQFKDKPLQDICMILVSILCVILILKHGKDVWHEYVGNNLKKIFRGLRALFPKREDLKQHGEIRLK